MEDWAEIRLLRRQGLSIRAIASQVGCAKKTVERALASDRPPEYKKRQGVASAFDNYEAQVRLLLQKTPTLPATVLAERVGWQGSASWFRENVAKIRPEYAVVDPVDYLDHQPGVQIQCDLTFPKGGLPGSDGVRRDYPVLVMVAAHSRFMASRVLPTRATGDLLAGMWQLLSTDFGVIPRELLWDHEAGIGVKKLTAPVVSFAGTLGLRVRQAPPRDPETKGVIERANGYLDSSFFPGRDFTSISDVQCQLDHWVTTVANQRLHATTREVPAHRWQAEREVMAPLPPQPPQIGQTYQRRLPRQYYVSVDTNRYSVHPQMIGRIVTVKSDLERVWVLSPDGQLVASHERVWAKHQIVTDPTHAAAARQIRRSNTSAPPQQIVQVHSADLSAYDMLVEVGS